MGTDKITIIGIGEVPTANNPGRTQRDIIYDTCMEAVRDLGLDKNDIEGVISVAPPGPTRHYCRAFFRETSGRAGA